jgi:hypothetical protein
MFIQYQVNQVREFQIILAEEIVKPVQEIAEIVTMERALSLVAESLDSLE